MGSALGSAGEVFSTVADPLDVLGFRAGARAQEDAANSQMKQQWADRSEAQRYAEATPEELANLQNSIKFAQYDIDRKQKLLDSADPALIEAGKNALAMLKGQEAGVLGPMKQNIARQESTLRQRLAAQYGPGYESTTAGQNALAAFQQQANMSLEQAQQASLGQLLGVVQNTAAQNANLNMQQTLGQMLGGIQGRKINTLQGFGVDPALGYAGQMSKAQILPKMINTASQVAGIISGAGAFTGGSLGANLGMGGGAPSGDMGLGGSMNTGIDTSGYGKYMGG